MKKARATLTAPAASKALTAPAVLKALTAPLSILALAALASCDDGIKRTTAPELAGETLTVASSSIMEFAVPKSFSLYNDIDTASVSVPFGREFKIQLEDKWNRVAALSPSRVSRTGARDQVLTVSPRQCPSAIGLIDTDSYPMYAVDTVRDGRAEFILTPAAGAFRILLRGAEGEALDSAVFTPASDRPFCGSMRADITASPVFTEGDSSEPVRLSYPSPALLSDGYVCVSLARQNYSGIAVKAWTSRGSYTFTVDDVKLGAFDVFTTGYDLESGSFIPGVGEGSLENPTADPALTEPGEDLTEDIIPDFSRVGYRWGDRGIPTLPVVATLSAPSDSSDATSLINDAIASAQTPGAILLKAGTYRVSSSININRSGVALRGEGEGRTVILGTGSSQITIVTMGGGSVSYGAGTDICEDYVPVGRMYVKVENPGMFTPGERVAIYRPGTAAWISAIRMDQIPMASDQSTVQWKPSNFNMYWERVVTKVEGDRVYFENPVVMALDSSYGGGKLFKVSSERISGCGLENLTIDSEFDRTLTDTYAGVDVYVDENHAFNALSVRYAEHCWVRNVTAVHYGGYAFSLATGSKNITVQDCTAQEPVSVVTGGNRYAFHFSGSQLSLIRDCICTKDRHQYVTGACVSGPDVFLDCVSLLPLAEAGPHQRWATGVLYDCVKVPGWLVVQDRDNWGTGHGWAGANFVLWNCEAVCLVCQSPWASAKNYAVGCVGAKTETQKADVTGRPDGEWASQGSHVTSGTWYGAAADGLSLYRAQKAARKGDACPSNCY